jgi:hypothetical protein
MAADNFTATLSIQYTPPGSPANSGVASFASGGTYQAGQAGTIDVTSAATIGEVFPIPFGSVAAAKMLIVRNGLSAEVGVRLNGAGSNTFNVPPGGEFAYIVPTAPLAVPLTSVSLVTTAVPVSTERAIFAIFGD